MKQGCETLEEYRLSKYLLYKYLQSKPVVDNVSTLFYSNVELYLKKYIETHESKFLFCFRKHIRHYGEYSNTILEGCNNGLKYHSTPVTPQTRLDNSFTIISNNSDLKNSLMDKTIYEQYHKNVTCKLSERKLCYTHLTPVAYETILSAFENIASFQCHRYDYCTWYVTRYQEAYDKVKSIIPRFKHVRTVTLYEDRLSCNCPHGSLYGLPCIHEMKVASIIPG